MSADNYHLVRRRRDGTFAAYANLSASSDREPQVRGCAAPQIFEIEREAAEWADAQGYAEYGVVHDEEPVSPAQAANDGLAIVEYWQDADSFGWAILALFTVRSGVVEGPRALRWGVLDCLTGTENGAGNADAPEGEEREDAIRRHWWLVDWYADEHAARAALAEARSRRW